MRRFSAWRWAIALAFVLAVGRLAYPQEVYRTGQNVQPVFEGWQRNPGGTFSLYFGYLNRNYAEEPNVAIGPNNAFQPGPAAASKAFARCLARRLCRLEALGLTRTIPSTISMPAHCSSDQESYCSALICACIHAGATISAVMVCLLRGAPRSQHCQAQPTVLWS